MVELSELSGSASSRSRTKPVCGYNYEESINRAIKTLIIDKSDINDGDLYHISSHFIAEAVDLSHHHSRLLSFEGILDQIKCGWLKSERSQNA